MELTADQLRHRFPEITRYMTQEQLRVLIDYFDRRTVRAGTQIIQDGEQSKTMHLIVQGRVSIVLNLEQQDLIVGSLGPGAWVGEIAVMDPGPACASVIAAEECDMFTISLDAFADLQKSHPIIASLLLQVLCAELAGRLRASNRLLMDLIAREEKTRPAVIGDPEWVKQLGAQLAGTRGKSS